MEEQIVEVKKIKKSELAMYKGFGWKNDQIAKKLKIDEKEVIQGLQRFGMMKTRGVNNKGYEIQFIDDSSQYQPLASESLNEIH